MNSEPQLIAEAIAMSQANGEVITSRKRARSAHNESSGSSSVEQCCEDKVLGVRVNGLKFLFYSISVSDEVLSAMSRGSVATKDTFVSRLENGNRNAAFDWTLEADCLVIIRVLDAMCKHLSYEGSQSGRHPSFSSSSKCYTQLD